MAENSQTGGIATQDSTRLLIITFGFVGFILWKVNDARTALMAISLAFLAFFVIEQGNVTKITGAIGDDISKIFHHGPSDPTADAGKKAGEAISDTVKAGDDKKVK